jgi:hypothetical protein
MQRTGTSEGEKGVTAVCCLKLKIRGHRFYFFIFRIISRLINAFSSSEKLKNPPVKIKKARQCGHDFMADDFSI